MTLPPEASPSPPPKASRLWRSLKRLSLALLMFAFGVGLFAWAFGERVASHLVRAKLQTLVASHLNANLEMGELHYSFPRGVTVDNASLVTQPGPGKPSLTLASFRALKLTLAELPLKRGPLRIERLHIVQPTVHLIRTEQGFGGDEPLVRQDRPLPTTGPAKKKLDLSEWFRLRQLKLEDARIEFDDRRKQGVVPLVWEKLGINIDANPLDDGRTLSFKFTATHANVSDIASAGTLDLQTLLLDVKSLEIDARVAPDHDQSPLPAPVQRVLKQFKIAGAAKLTVAAQVPLTSVRDSQLNGTLEVTNAQGRLPGWPMAVDDFAALATCSYAHRKLVGRMDRLVLRSGGSALSVQPVEQFEVDFAQRRWLCVPIRAAVAYFPPASTPHAPEPPPPLRQPISVMVKAAVAQQPHDWRGVDVSLDGTSARFADAHEVVIETMVAYFDRQLVVRRGSIVGLGGRVEITGTYDARERRGDTNLSLSNVELAALLQTLNPTKSTARKGLLTGSFRGAFTEGTLKSIAGDGRFRIDEGEFAQAPVLGAIANGLNLGKDLFIARKMTGRFQVAERLIHFDRIAVSSDAMRIGGTGDVTFDRSLNLSVYADTASNWGDDVKGTNVPVLSDVAGTVAGGTQKVIGTLSKQFTHLRVTGTMDDPKVTPAPAPLLTEDLVGLFQPDD